jgi:hypothetical protein
VSLAARTPREALRIFQDHLNSVLNKVLTRYRLEFLVSIPTRGELASLSFLDRRRVSIAIPLSASLWHLYLGQDLKIIPEGKDFSLRVVKYEYRIQRTPLLQDEAEVRFEYVSSEIEPLARYCRHHVQFHRDFQDVREGFSPNKLHIPTGGVTIEDVIRFLIVDLNVPPLTEQWEEELRRSAELTREWIGDAVE